MVVEPLPTNALDFLALWYFVAHHGVSYLTGSTAFSGLVIRKRISWDSIVFIIAALAGPNPHTGRMNSSAHGETFNTHPTP